MGAGHQHFEPGKSERAEDVEYREVDGLPHPLFFCPRYHATLSTAACAKRYCTAIKTSAGQVDGQISQCRTCPIGRRHAGDTGFRVSVLSSDLSGICCRCSRGSIKLINQVLCPLCSNRNYELLRGRNAKGTRPTQLKAMNRTVWFRIGDDGEDQEATFLCRDAGEAIIAVRLNAGGVQITDIIEGDGISLRPTFADFDSFKCGKYAYLRHRTLASGEVVVVEEPPVVPEMPPAEVAAQTARLDKAAVAAEIEARATPFDDAIHERANRVRFTVDELADIDSILRTTFDAPRASGAACARALNAAGIHYPRTASVSTRLAVTTSSFADSKRSAWRARGPAGPGKSGPLRSAQ
jgi:hypothetical protein